MKSLAIPAALAALLVSGCQERGLVVGGPCSYTTDVVTATVIEAGEDGALFDGPDGTFFVSEDYVSPVPEVGETLTMKRERITKGTCTPEIYRLADEPQGT